MNGMMWSRVQTSRPDLDSGQPRLLLELAPKRLLGGLARLDPSARRRPERPARELEADEQDPVVRVDHDRPRRGTDPELAHRVASRQLVAAP